MSGIVSEPSRSAVFAHRQVWERKPALRAVYLDLYRRMAERCAPGALVEIGAGPGLLKTVLHDAIAMDVRHFPWVDAVCDAHALPLKDQSVGTIAMFDVLHHLARPKIFFEQAQRALRPGGRIVIVEPAITPVSGAFYRMFHHEPVRMEADPLGDEALSSRDPDDSNQAIATLMFGRDEIRFAALFPQLKVVEKTFLSLLAYPLSGGFQDWSLLPKALAAPLLRVESALLPAVGRLAAFRLLIVIEKAG